jgi:penicillin V acylase-like amidase (Ntn superfamily)
MIHEKKSKSFFIFFFCVFFLSFVTVNACSVTALEDEDRLIVARNMDWPEPDGLVVMNPKEIKKTATFVPEDLTPLTWQSEYGSITFDLLGTIPEMGTLNSPGGGLNEAGLYVGTLFADEMVCPSPTGKKAVTCIDIVRLLLDTCKTADEALDMLSNIDILPLTLNDIQVTFHYFIIDRTGKCFIVEFPSQSKGRMMIHTPLYKTTTNEFYEVNAFILHQYEPFGGDKPIPESNVKRTSEVRLTRATYYSLEAMKKGEISFDDGFFVMEAARQFEGIIASDSATDWTVCFDLKNLVIEWTSFFNPERRSIDMKQLSFNDTGKMVSVDIQSSGTGDYTKYFK